MPMPLVTAHELLADAKKKKYAIGAFNANNLEYVQGIIAGAEAEHAPVIIQASPGAIRYAGLDNIVAMVGAAATNASVPVVLHLDHGEDLDLVTYCIRRGFTSVMFDGSRLSFVDNVRLTTTVVRMAHRAGITAEGELGVVPAATDQWSPERLADSMTDPDEATTFVRETGVDSLAVAVGSVHQLRSHRSSLDTDRIAVIARSTEVPLVLHGSSGVEREDIPRGIAAGLCKVNIATALHEAFTGALRATTRSLADEVDPRRLLAPARAAVTEVVSERIQLLGSSGRAAGRSRAAGGGGGRS